MSLSNRRSILIAGAALLLSSACNFSPVYGPEGAGSKLEGRILFDAPDSRDEYILVRQLETRLGRADPAPMSLTYSVSNSSSSLGTTATGSTTRLHRYGSLSYTLKNTATGETITTGSFRNFAAYSATSNTAATLASERAASERLMTLLADQLVDRLNLLDPALLP
ncbi:LPS assembly lipoprotein LptE [Planktotalea sp.]|uniref:LPS assembly lipoprotein LptE n=1 Tax=Planktotalea sp. TaxID=2029877 RepID=UPI003296A7DB